MGDLLARQDEGGGNRAHLKRRDTVARLCGNADFREWLYAELDNMCAFDGVDANLTEFGTGIRATAAEIISRLLVAPEAVKMLADFAQKNFKARHEGIAASFKTDTTTHRKRI